MAPRYRNSKRCMHEREGCMMNDNLWHCMYECPFYATKFTECYDDPSKSLAIFLCKLNLERISKWGQVLFLNINTYVQNQEPDSLQAQDLSTEEDINNFLFCDPVLQAGYVRDDVRGLSSGINATQNSNSNSSSAPGGDEGLTTEQCNPNISSRVTQMSGIKIVKNNISTLRLGCMKIIEKLSGANYVVAIEEFIKQVNFERDTKEKMETIKFYKKKKILFAPSISYLATAGQVSIVGYTSMVTQTRTSIRSRVKAVHNLLSTCSVIYQVSNMSNMNCSEDMISEDIEEIRNENSEEITEMKIETDVHGSTTAVKKTSTNIEEEVTIKSVVKEERFRDGKLTRFRVTKAHSVNKYKRREEKTVRPSGHGDPRGRGRRMDSWTTDHHYETLRLDYGGWDRERPMENNSPCQTSESNSPHQPQQPFSPFSPPVPPRNNAGTPVRSIRGTMTSYEDVSKQASLKEARPRICQLKDNDAVTHWNSKTLAHERAEIYNSESDNSISSLCSFNYFSN